MLGYHAYEKKLDELFGKQAMNETPGSSRRNRSRSPASSPATPRCAPWGAPATTCTIAATTSSRSPTRCEFEEIAYLLIHEQAAERAPSSPPTRRSLKSLRGLPDAVRTVLEALPATAHPMDVLRTGVSVLGCVLPEKDDHDARRRARHRRPADRLARLDARLLVSLQPLGRAHRRSRPTTTPSAGTSCTCCTAAARRPRGCAPCTPRSSCTPSTSSTPRPSPRASSPAPAPICTPASPARSARCAARSTAARTRSPSRSRSATRLPTRPRPTSARASGARRSIIGFGHPVYTVADPRNEVIKEVARRLVAGRPATCTMFDDRRAHRGGDARRPRRCSPTSTGSRRSPIT